MKVLILLVLPLLSVNCKSLVFQEIKIYVSESHDSQAPPVSYGFSSNTLLVHEPYTKAVIVDENVPELPKNSVTNLELVEKIFFSRTGTNEIQSGAFTKLPKLQQLEISGNSIKKLPAKVFDCPNLETLAFSHNHLEELDPKAFEGLSNLKKLDLSHNHLKQLQPATFQYVPKVKYLDLSRNDLSYISDVTFKYLNKFPEIIRLNNNGMKGLSPYAFADDIRIENLVLDHNKLSEVDFTKRTRSVSRLNITKNFIECMDAKLVKKVVYFYADENPWKCDCFKKFLNEKKDTTDIWAPDTFQKCGMKQYRLRYY